MAVRLVLLPLRLLLLLLSLRILVPAMDKALSNVPNTPVFCWPGKESLGVSNVQGHVLLSWSCCGSPRVLFC